MYTLPEGTFEEEVGRCNWCGVEIFQFTGHEIADSCFLCGDHYAEWLRGRKSAQMREGSSGETQD